MSKLLFLASTFLLLSCATNKPERKNIAIFQDGKQQLNLNRTNQYGDPKEPVKVITVGKDTVKSGERAYFRTYLNSPDYELLRAYFHCQVNNESLIDTSTFEVNNCGKQLVVRNDSVIIEFTAGVPGIHNFLEMILISQDNQGIFRYHKSTFDYLATE
jgi:hypothetical protein